MIEAVNSSVANSAVLRASVEQAASARAVQATPPAVRDAVIELPKAPYISPYISVDPNYNKAVLQIRDSETGDVVQQFPTESRLAEIRRSQVALQSRELTSTAPSPDVPKANTAPASEPIRVDAGNSIRVSAEIITVQDATSTPPANVTTPPQIAAAALSAGAQSGSSALSSSVTVFA